MLSGFARTLLVLTSLAPIALVHGVARWPADRHETIAYLAVAAALVFVCLLLMWFARKDGEIHLASIKSAKNSDKEVLAFLVAYALPLVGPAGKPSNGLALAVFLSLLAVVLFQTEMVHVNPLLGMLGFRFFEVEQGSGETALMITRSKESATGEKRIVKLSRGLWLEVTK
jgi:hypothetical protein